MSTRTTAAADSSPQPPTATSQQAGVSTSDAAQFAPSDSFSFTQARGLIKDLNRPNAKIYWADFLCSILGGHVCVHLTWGLPTLYGLQGWVIPAVALTYVATVLLYMRALMFIHELVHLPQDSFKGFRIAWNTLCGIFFFVPSFLYYPHVDHHRRKHYGTEHDGEYIGLSNHGTWMIVGFIAQALLIPFLAIGRFLILSPICWLVPGARQWVHRHASTMVVDPFYERPDATAKQLRIVVMQEFFCFIWCVWFLVRGGIMRDQWVDPFWLVGYAVGVGVLVLNEVRTLGAHRWTNDRTEMTFEAQLLDSVNYPNRPWISELWGPIGTRFHALHHLFPGLPYHNLGQAHRRLAAGLPADSIYHQTTATSLITEIKALWRRAAASGHRPDHAAPTVSMSAAQSDPEDLQQAG